MYPIPANATRIRYLQGASSGNDDGPYIITDVKVSNNPIVEASVQPTDLSTFSWFCGCRRFNSPTGNFNVGINNSTGYPRVVYGTGADVNDNTAVSTSAFTTIKATHTTLYVNGVSRKTYSNTIGTQFSSGPNFALFNVLQTGGTTQTGNGMTGRIAWCKVWNDDGATLVGDFVPVRVGNTGYMFNRVTGELLGATNGILTLGPDTFSQGVVPTRMMAMGVRKKPYDAEVEYLESTGTGAFTIGPDKT